MSTIQLPGRGGSKPAIWNQPVTQTGEAKINAPTAAEALANPKIELTDEEKSERFADPLKFQKGGEIAIHGAVQAGTAHPEYVASQKSVNDHPSSLPEAEASQNQDVA